MAKEKKVKSFSSGISTLLGDTEELISSLEKETRGRPKTSTKVIKSSSEDGTKEGETRATFIVKKRALDKLKKIAYYDRSMIKDIVNKALELFISEYEKEMGKTIEEVLSDYEKEKKALKKEKRQNKAL